MIILLLIQYFGQRPLSRKNMHFNINYIVSKEAFINKNMHFNINYIVYKEASIKKNHALQYRLQSLLETMQLHIVTMC